MTLYLLFERLEAGKIKLTTEMPVSAHAAAQAPSKLGLKPGETHRGRNRDPRHRHQIGQRRGGRSWPKRSAGNETEFAKLMTAKAHALGMKHTDLPQRLRPARRPADHHRARPGHSRPRHPGPLPEILSLLLHPHVRLPRQGDAQPQSSARAASTASTASRPAISTIPASTSSPRSTAAAVTSWRWCSADAPPARATRACAA